MTTIELLNTVKDNTVHAFYVMYDNYNGTEGEEKFLNNPIGRAAAAKFYDNLKAPYKKINYDNATTDVDLVIDIDRDFWATFE